MELILSSELRRYPLSCLNFLNRELKIYTFLNFFSTKINISELTELLNIKISVIIPFLKKLLIVFCSNLILNNSIPFLKNYCLIFLKLLSYAFKG